MYDRSRNDRQQTDTADNMGINNPLERPALGFTSSHINVVTSNVSHFSQRFLGFYDSLVLPRRFLSITYHQCLRYITFLGFSDTVALQVLFVSLISRLPSYRVSYQLLLSYSWSFCRLLSRSSLRSSQRMRLGEGEQSPAIEAVRHIDSCSAALA